LRKREVLFGMTNQDPGPPFLGRFFGHFYRCLSCDVQAQAEAQVHEPETITVGKLRQTLADDWAISSSCNTKRILGLARKEPKAVFKAERSYEDDRNLFYGSVLHIGDRFRMWYMPFTGVQAIADSYDGITWTRPDLTVFPAQKILPAHMESKTTEVTLTGSPTLTLMTLTLIF